MNGFGFRLGKCGFVKCSLKKLKIRFFICIIIYKRDECIHLLVLLWRPFREYDCDR